MIEQELKSFLEQEELETVSDAFGGTKATGKTKSYSVPKIRDLLLAKTYSPQGTPLEAALAAAKKNLGAPLFKLIVGNLIRFSFLIELTNLKVGSTKMKTRWVPGYILMPQANSFEPIRGQFLPGNEPRAATYDECVEIFIWCLNEVVAKCSADNSVKIKLQALGKCSSVPYESAFDYANPHAMKLHVVANIKWVVGPDLEWLLKARPLIKAVFKKKLKKILDKIQTKTFKTDRALTGKDKTNRAKRWEVLADDFQHAALSECWTVEKKLYEQLGIL